MKHIKKFDSYSINEEFDRYDLGKLVMTSKSIFSVAIDLFLLKWSKIPGTLRKVGKFNKLMNVLRHIINLSNLGANSLSKKELIDLLKSKVGHGVVNYSHITSGPDVNDLSMAYTILSYDGDLGKDIKDSIEFIESLDPDKKIKLKDVGEILNIFNKMIDNRRYYQSVMLIEDL